MGIEDGRRTGDAEVVELAPYIEAREAQKIANENALHEGMGQAFTQAVKQRVSEGLHPLDAWDSLFGTNKY